MLNWREWQTGPSGYRYRTGSQYRGGTEWDRWVELENPGTVTLNFSHVHYGSVQIPTIYHIEPGTSLQIKLSTGPVASWGWDVTP